MITYHIEDTLLLAAESHASQDTHQKKKHAEHYEHGGDWRQYVTQFTDVKRPAAVKVSYTEAAAKAGYRTKRPVQNILDVPSCSYYEEDPHSEKQRPYNLLGKVHII